MAINSKKKGNAFELSCAKLLTELTGAKWHRVGVSSGARATYGGIQDPRYRGDVFSEEEEYSGLVIECKKIKDRISLEDLARCIQRRRRILRTSNRVQENKGQDLIRRFSQQQQHLLGMDISS
jgi:hypothetical protein